MTYPNEALAEAIKADLTALAHWSPEDWAERGQGGDPIARTINAARDIVDRRFAALLNREDAPDKTAEVLQAVWDLGDELDSNHTRFAAGQVTDRFGVTIRAHNDFSNPPRNRNEETIEALQCRIDELEAVREDAPSREGLDVDRLLEFVAEQPSPGDWACAECRPDSHMLVAGFRCVVHEARAVATPPGDPARPLAAGGGPGR